MKTLLKKCVVFYDIIFCAIAACIVAFAFHYFANHNNFAPGGVNGLAAMSGYLFKMNMAYFVVLYNLPIFITVFILINKKTASMLIVYMSFQAIFLFLFEEWGVPYYKTSDNLIFAAIGAGVVSGFGFSLMLKRFGASGGTYAISSIIRYFKPEKNLAWVAFVMDASVVFLAFFVYEFNVDSIICTLINLFIANVVVDYVLQGVKTGYKFEIITSESEALAKEILEKFGHGVTRIEATGMYSNQAKSILICIVRKRNVGEFINLLKKYPLNFTSISRVNEVIGKFKK
jgi:uncharacterized membrane-anchored protein YitT (DUF2179 family)